MVRLAFQEVTDVDIAALLWSSQPIVEEPTLHDLPDHVAVEGGHIGLSEVQPHTPARWFS